MAHRIRVLVSSLFALCFFLFSPLSAQTFRAQITGVVTDNTAAVIPGVEVRATNLATGVISTGLSNEQGIYRMPNLQPGRYRVEVELPGFKRFVQEPVILQVNDRLALDISLQVGEITDAITVVGQSPLLETEDASVGTVVNERAIQELPLDVRDSISLIVLTPGVITRQSFGAGGGPAGGSGVGRNWFQSDFNVGGASGHGQELLMDGAPSTSADRSFATYIPPVDSTQEFRVQVNTYSAEFGRTTGGVLNVVTKSGTNDFHGTAYEFHRNSVLDANDFFANRAGIEQPPFRRHQFGANLGGPIWKDQTFFFVAYEGLRQAFPTTATSTVPTDLQRKGDFSQTFARDGKLITIYDPLTLRTNQKGDLVRDPFPRNVIPENRWDPVARKVLEFYPRPNQVGDPMTGANNFVFADQSTTDRNGIDVRLDHNFGQANKIFGRWSRQRLFNRQPRNWDNVASFGTRLQPDTFHQAVIEDTHIFSPTLTGHLRLSFTRGHPEQVAISRGFDLSQLGFPADYVQAVAPFFPFFTISDMTAMGNAFFNDQPRNTYALQGGGTKMFERHSLKVGFDLRLLEFHALQNNNPTGRFTFGRLFTQGPDPLRTRADAGFGFASFLLGAGTSGNVEHVQALSLERTYWAFYVQDDWKVTSNLTLNLGLRYDLEIGQKERFNRQTNLDLVSPSPLSEQVGSELKGLVRFLGTDGWPRNQLDTDKNNLGPRLGIAYKLADRTVVRAGYGIFYNPMVVIADGAIGFNTQTPWVATIDRLRPENLLRNPFPQGFNLPKGERDALTNIGFGLRGFIRSERVGYSQLWSLSVQHQFSNNFLLDLGYWGNKGTKLQWQGWQENFLPNRFLELKSALNKRVPNPFFGVIESGPLSGKTVARGQLLLPFPQYTSASRTRVSAGSSIYHGFTLRAEKRLSAGLSFLGVYTISKNISDARGRENSGGVSGILNMENRRAERALIPWDVPQRLVASFIYDLPFGRDRRFGTATKPALNAVLGGWTFSGIATFQSGFPLSIDRPSVNNGQSAKLNNSTIDEWFDTSVFSPAEPFTFGNVGPVLPDVRGDGIRSFDFNLAKNFYFAERFRLQFRTEFFNAFNTPQFAQPQDNVVSPGFGRVSSQANSSRSIQFALKLYW